MAVNDSELSNGDSDFQAHVKTYRGFLRGVRYAVGAAIIILILMAIFLL